MAIILAGVSKDSPEFDKMVAALGRRIESLTTYAAKLKASKQRGWTPAERAMAVASATMDAQALQVLRNALQSSRKADQ